MGTIIFANRYITIYSFGLIMFLSFIAAYYLLKYIIAKKRLSDYKLLQYAPVITFGALVIGKLVYLLFNYSVVGYSGNDIWKEFFTFSSFNYDWYGVLLGMVITLVILYRRSVKLYEILDVSMLIFLFIMVWGWLGLFLSNIHYGTETSLPIGIVLHGLDLEVSNMLVHPVQLYYMIGYLIIFLYYFTRYIQRVLSGSIFVKSIVLITLLDIGLTFFIQKCSNVIYMFCYNQYLAFITLFSVLFFYILKIKS